MPGVQGNAVDHKGIIFMHIVQRVPSVFLAESDFGLTEPYQRSIAGRDEEWKAQTMARTEKKIQSTAEKGKVADVQASRP